MKTCCWVLTSGQACGKPTTYKMGLDDGKPIRVYARFCPEHRYRANRKTMTLNELIEKLEAVDEGDSEMSHIEADGLLLEYIGNERVKELHKNLAVWYA